MVGAGSKGPKFLRSQKVSIGVPDPKNAHDRTTLKRRRSTPTSFRCRVSCGDYAAFPGTTYRFRVSRCTVSPAR